MSQTDGKVKMLAVGDILPNREKPETAYELVKDSLKGYDLKFGQWEIIVSERGAKVSEGARAHPRNATILKDLGFDICSFASNHAMDWGPEGLFDTLDNVRKQGTICIGAGKDLEESRQPAIIERNGTRIGFLAYNSVMNYGYWAAKDKPGCAPIRVMTHYEMLEPGQPGCPPKIFTYPYKEDLANMVEDIKKLKKQVDVLVLSLHWGLHFTRAKIATYQPEVGHAAIDAGADIIIGTHAHILKGFEVYKGKVIFYSLCNFILDSTMRTYPNLSPEAMERFKVYNWVVEPDWARTYPHPPESRNTFVVNIYMNNKKIEKVAFLPTVINIKAQPRIVKASEPEFKKVTDYVTAITDEANLNGRFKVEGDEAVVQGI